MRSFPTRRRLRAGGLASGPATEAEISIHLRHGRFAEFESVFGKKMQTVAHFVAISRAKYFPINQKETGAVLALKFVKLFGPSGSSKPSQTQKLREATHGDMPSVISN